MKKLFRRVLAAVAALLLATNFAAVVPAYAAPNASAKAVTVKTAKSAAKASKTAKTAKTAAIDPATVLTELAGSGMFSTTPTLLDSEYFSMLTGIDDSSYKDVLAYVSGGTDAEIAVVFTTSGKKASKALVKECKSYVSEQEEVYQDYDPSQVAKLENAIIKYSGKYVIMAVPADKDAASKVISKYIK